MEGNYSDGVEGGFQNKLWLIREGNTIAKLKHSTENRDNA